MAIISYFLRHTPVSCLRLDELNVQHDRLFFIFVFFVANFPHEFQSKKPSLWSSCRSTSSDATSGDSTGLWTTVKRKSRSSRASVARFEGQADATADITAASIVLVNDAAPSSSLIRPVPYQQSSSTSSAEEASARAQAKWFTAEDMHPRSQSQSSQPIPNPHSEEAECAKEGHAKRRCSACLQQSQGAPGKVAPLQKPQTGKNWAAVTADNPDEQVATVRDLASFPLFNRSSEFGAVGDRVVSYQAIKAKVDTGMVRMSSDSDASEILAKRSVESADSSFSSPRSLGSLSPRSQSSTLDGMSDEDEHAGKSSAAELEYVARQNLTRPKDPVNDLKVSFPYPRQVFTFHDLTKSAADLCILLRNFNNPAPSFRFLSVKLTSFVHRVCEPSSQNKRDVL